MVWCRADWKIRFRVETYSVGVKPRYSWAKCWSSSVASQARGNFSRGFPSISCTCRCRMTAYLTGCRGWRPGGCRQSSSRGSCTCVRSSACTRWLTWIFFFRRRAFTPPSVHDAIPFVGGAIGVTRHSVALCGMGRWRSSTGPSTSVRPTPRSSRWYFATSTLLGASSAAGVEHTVAEAVPHGQILLVGQHAVRP